MATILVVEDEEAVVEITSELLAVLGHTCLTARTGAEGLRIAAERPDIDLVLLDRSLPDMDGLAVLDQAGFTAPVVLCTGDAFDLDEIRHRFAAVLNKPYTVDELQAVLARHLPA